MRQYMHRRIPQGRIGRLARLAAAGARSGAGMLLSKRANGSADRAAEILGTLRGLAAKVGQMASYVDGVIPPEHQGAYEAAMKKLRAAAPSSSPEEAQKIVEKELKKPIGELFSEWSPEPFASASIGQVHKARLPDGREVAVKVQHPGIARAIESDLANAAILEHMAAAMGARKLNSRGMLEVVRKRFREELDYELEARHQKEFAALHAEFPRIRIPLVIEERSSKRVLCTEFVRGKTFEEACESPEKDREKWVQTLWRFVFKGNLVGGMFNADPHPGNYFFHEDGAVTFLDFGCVQPLADWHRNGAVDLHRAAMVRDEELFRTCCAKFLGTKPGVYEDSLVRFVRACFTPLFSSPYRITRDFAGSLVEHVKGVSQIARSAKEVAPVPPDFFFMNRLQFGFYSVLARLDVKVDFSAVERGFLSHELLAPTSR